MNLSRGRLGKEIASQAYNAGSIPVARSMESEARDMFLGFFIYENVAGLESVKCSQVD